MPPKHAAYTSKFKLQVIKLEEMRDLFDESEEEEVFLGIDNED